MLYDINKLARVVRMRMGHSPGTRPLIRCRDPDVLNIDDMIGAAIVAAANEVAANCPLWMLAGTGHTMADRGVYWHAPVGGMYSGHVLLPDDFGRLLSFRMTDWAVSVSDVITSQSPRYLSARGPTPGLRGCPQRPLCLLDYAPEGAILHFGTCHDDQQLIAEATYMPTITVTPQGMADIPSRILEPTLQQVLQTGPPI